MATQIDAAAGSVGTSTLAGARVHYTPVANYTPTGLEIRDGVDWQTWRKIGDEIERDTNSKLWQIADWAAYGERWFRKSHETAIWDLAKKTFWNYAAVARAVESSRRREDLSFSHHAEVASLEPDMQSAFLADAVFNSWSVAQLREAVAKYRSKNSRDRLPVLALKIKGDQDLYRLCAQAAEAAGMPEDEWAYQVLETAAREQLALGVAA